MAQVVEATDNEVTAAGGGGQFLIALWRGKWILAVMLGIALALAYLYFLKSTPIYRSTAQVLLIKKDVAIPGAGGDDKRDRSAYGAYEDTMSTHMLLISSPLIVEQAVAKHQLGILPSLREAGDTKSAIIGSLKTMRAGGQSTPDPNVMTLSYEGLDPQDCQTILNALIQSYQDFLGDTYQTANEETVKLITQAKDVLHRQLSEKEANYRKFRQDSPLLWKGSEGANLHESRLAEIEKARSEAMIESAHLQGRIEAIEIALKKGGNREALGLLVANAGPKDGEVNAAPRNSFEEKIVPVLLEEQQLLEKFGPDHPNVRAIRTRINVLREHFGRDPLPNKQEHTDFLRVYVDSLGEELKVSQQRLAKYDELFEREKKAAKEIAASQIEDETYRSEIARTQQMFNAVIKRLEEISLIKDYGGVTTKLISPPEVGFLVGPQQLKIMLQGGLLGVLAGCGLIWLLDRLDKSFRSPEEIRRQLELPVVGHIPMIDPPATNGAAVHAEEGQPVLDPILCSYHRRRGRPAEAYRAVRTSLFFSIRRENQKVIQITSPNPGDGKSTLAANLAISIADSDKRVLLVDADFRRPRLESLFGLQGTVGLRSVLLGEAEIPDAVQQTSVQNLWVMTAGGTPSNPADLLTSLRFKEFLDSQRDQYDFVIIDTPPILAVTDACAVAPRADAVLLVIRLGKDAREGAMHAVETLGELGSQILGIVVNGIGNGAAYGAKYGHYNYRYNHYRYHYGYIGKKGHPNGDLYFAEAAVAGSTNGKASNGKASPSGGPPLQPNHADATPPEA